MSLSATQISDLQAPLSTANVKKNPRGYDYVEGWHAIAEANRIFGFDNWTRETMDIKCVSEKERKIGVKENFAGYDGWGVTYLCKVRVIACGVAREGCGAGHGIDRDQGLAHESAIKEAETDAMKRALMTFGNPFGLALYDKTKANVAAEGPAPVTALEKNSFMVETREAIAGFDDPEALATWWSSDAQKKARRDYELDQSQVDGLKQAVIKRREELTKQKAV